MVENRWKYTFAILLAITLLIFVTFFENKVPTLTTSAIKDAIQDEVDLGTVQVSHNSEKLAGNLKTRCPIYSFVRQITKANEQEVKFWNRAWFNQGFAPYVLTEKDALSRPEFGKLMSKIPSTDYYSGYMRWLAMASVQGGLFVDINIIPMNGHGKLFSKYVETCKPDDPLTIYEHFGYKIFQGNSTSIHNFVRRLSNEKTLKGKDEAWLTANKSSYDIAVSEEQIAAVDVMNNVYFQRHRRFSHHLQFSPESLKKYLARVNFLNNYRIILAKQSENLLESAIEGSIRRSLECPFPITIGFDTKKIIPNEDFTCSISDLTTLQQSERKILGDGHLSTVMEKFLILVNNPDMKRVNQTTISSLLSSANLKDQIQNLSNSGQFIFLPVDENYEDLKTFLEFKFGFPLDVVPDYFGSNEEVIEGSENKAAETNEDKQLYEHIKKIYNEELKIIKEFS